MEHQMKVTVNWMLRKEPKGMHSVVLDPVPVLKHYSENNNAEIRKCPAYLNFLKNTFVILSPCDLKIEINAQELWANVIEPRFFPKDRLNLRFDQSHGSPYPMFSLIIPEMVFTSDHDVILELVDPFMEWERKNPVRIIGGQFNIHKWVRPVECAYEANRTAFTYSIKRGDPLHYVRFYTDNPSDIIQLQRVEITDAIEADILENTSIKNYKHGSSLEFLYELRSKYKSFLKRKN
jgi:hypothetical protein